MSVDYSGVGGIGIEFTDEIKDAFVAHGLFTNDDWAMDVAGCMDIIGLPWKEAGSCFVDAKLRIYILVKGENLLQINHNATAFCNDLRIVGINISPNDLQIISDVFVY